MNDTLQTDLLSWPTVILSFLSFLSCIYVCCSSYKASNALTKTQTQSGQYYQMQHNKTDRSSTMMMDIIFWMCITDGLHDIELILNWLPQALHIPYWGTTPCKILGFFGQFFGIQSPTWHVILAYHLCFLLVGGTLDSLNRQKVYHFVVAWLTPIICCIIPMVYNHSYGMYQNNRKIKDFECWISDVNIQMIWVFFNILALFAHFITLLLALYKWKKSIIAFSHHYKQIVIKIVRFVIVYTLIRLLPTVDRIVELFIASNSEPFGLIFSHHVCLAITGIGNGIVWTINQKYDPIKNEKQFSYEQYKNRFAKTTSTSAGQEFDSSKGASSGYIVQAIE